MGDPHQKPRTGWRRIVAVYVVAAILFTGLFAGAAALERWANRLPTFEAARAEYDAAHAAFKAQGKTRETMRRLIRAEWQLERVKIADKRI